MIQIEYLPLVLTGIGIFVAIIYYTLTLRNANKTQQMALETRQTQLFLQLYGSATSENMQLVGEIGRWEWDDYDDFQEKYGSPEHFSKYNYQLQRFNGIGLLAMRDQIDLDLVCQFVGPVIISLWEKFRDVVMVRRGNEDVSDKRLEQLSGLEFLYEEMKKRLQ